MGLNATHSDASHSKGYRGAAAGQCHQGTCLLSTSVGVARDTPRGQSTYFLVKAVRSQVEVVEGDKVVFKEAQEQNQVHAICKLQRKLNDNPGACVGWTDPLCECRRMWECLTGYRACPRAPFPTRHPHTSLRTLSRAQGKSPVT